MHTEDMSHVAINFNYKESEPHVSQISLTPTKALLLFFVKSSDPGPFSIVHVRVPKNLPIYRLRPFISFCEEALKEIYGDAKRANLVLTQVEGEDWKLRWQVPAHQIAYA